jgi:peptidoglycan-N-acetylglucosamine deacetylase
MRKRRLPGPLAVFAATVALGIAPGATARLRSDPLDASGPLDLTRVGVEQVRRSVRLTVRTQARFSVGALSPRPRLGDPDARFLCLRIRRSGAALVRQLCFGTTPHRQGDALGYYEIAPGGSIRGSRTIKAHVKRPSQRSIIARFRPSDAHLAPHRYRWRFVSRWSGQQCPVPGAEGKDPCLDVAPNGHLARFRLREVQPVGCTHRGRSPVFHGSGHRRRVALTFDDGPSDYTPKILSILEHKHAKGTFFELGDQIPGRASTSRAILAAGDELANHSLHHETKPGRSSMAITDDRIRSATGFEPCLFRPPGGAYDARVVDDAASLGMKTVIWDVDPRDWSRPGAGAIYSRVVGAARPGSIVVMHDGGGDRSQTVAALPHIINALRRRGYRMVTVTKLLHDHLIWGVA